MNQGQFTTGEAARLCHCSRTMMIRYIDRGELAAWLVPGTRVRRINPPDLRAFLVAHEIPTDMLDWMVKLDAARERQRPGQRQEVAT